MILSAKTRKRVNRPYPGSDDAYEMEDVYFIIVAAESHGLRRVEPRPFTCSCGCDLIVEKLDEGDEQKVTWPRCKSWRNGGEYLCPSCDNKFTPPREQFGRRLGYEVRPKDDHSDKLTAARKRRAREIYGDRCLVCGGPYDDGLDERFLEATLPSDDRGVLRRRDCPR